MHYLALKGGGFGITRPALQREYPEVDDEGLTEFPSLRRAAGLRYATEEGHGRSARCRQVSHAPSSAAGTCVFGPVPALGVLPRALGVQRQY